MPLRTIQTFVFAPERKKKVLWSASSLDLDEALKWRTTYKLEEIV